MAKIEASFSGLSPGKHGWSINKFGDLTKGPTSTGGVFDPINHDKEALGHLQTLEVDEKVCISDLIGRSIVVYKTEDNSDAGIKAAVIARAAGIGEGCKKICACDGTPIWDLTDKDSVACKV